MCSVDLRNHGDSPWSSRNDMKAVVADISRFLDKQGIKKINLIGHSLGGKVAVHYALNNVSHEFLLLELIILKLSKKALSKVSLQFI